MPGQVGPDEDYDAAKDLGFQIQIGSTFFPAYPIKSSAEAFTQLRKPMVILDSTVFNFDITGHQYNKLHYILSIDTEKTLQAGYTGLDMQRGQLMVVKVKATDAAKMNTYNSMPDNMIIVLCSDQILDIGFTGVQVQD